MPFHSLSLPFPCLPFPFLPFPVPIPPYSLPLPLIKLKGLGSAVSSPSGVRTHFVYFYSEMTAGVNDVLSLWCAGKCFKQKHINRFLLRIMCYINPRFTYLLSVAICRIAFCDSAPKIKLLEVEVACTPLSRTANLAMQTGIHATIWERLCHTHTAYARIRACMCTQAVWVRH